MKRFLVLFEHGPIFTVFVKIGSANPTKPLRLLILLGYLSRFPKKGITKTYINVVVFGDLGGAGYPAPPKVSKIHNKYVGLLATF